MTHNKLRNLLILLLMILPLLLNVFVIMEDFYFQKCFPTIFFGSLWICYQQVVVYCLNLKSQAMDFCINLVLMDYLEIISTRPLLYFLINLTEKFLKIGSAHLPP